MFRGSRPTVRREPSLLRKSSWCRFRARVYAGRMDPQEEQLAGGGRTVVHRRGVVVLRSAGSWSRTVHALLRHLDGVGFGGAPRVVGNGFDELGRETLTYIEGDFVHPAPWAEEAMHPLGALLRSLHDAGESFRPPADACWRPWFGRDLGDYRRVYGHCDLGPWNIVARDGMPVALIDWETAGPVDALVELGQACWLNAQLHDDDVGDRVGLASPEMRAAQAALIADGYRLPRALGSRLVQAMTDVATLDSAEQAIEAQITPNSTDAAPLWGLAWRTRAAGWMIRQRQLLVRALS